MQYPKIVGTTDYPLVQPIRYIYRHNKCNTITTIDKQIALTFAMKPKFYTSTYCSNCNSNFKVDEFSWVNNDGTNTSEIVGRLNYV